MGFFENWDKLPQKKWDKGAEYRGLDKSVDRKYNDDVNWGKNSCRWIVNQKMVVAGNDARFVKRLDKVGEVYAQ